MNGLLTECENCSGPGIFCPACGKVIDREALRSVGIQTFRGRFSLKPSIERMYETGSAPG